MKAVLVDPGENLVMAEVPDPVPREGEVLIRIRAAGVNRADLLQRAGKYPSPSGWPDRMGLECAGEVLEAPSGSRFRKGDAVCALLGGGGYAEKIAVPEELVMPVPGRLSMIEAASLPEVFATAYLNLKFEADLKPGETFLMQAAASGLGTAAIQIAKIMGAKVIGVAGSPEKVEFIRTLGADIAVNRKTESLARVLEANPPDVSLDCVAGPALGENLARMARGGRWILISTLGGEAAEIPLRTFFKLGLTLKGSSLRTRSNGTKEQVLRGLEAEVWPAIEQGRIRPVVCRIFSADEAEKAHALLESGGNAGKVVLRF